MYSAPCQGVALGVGCCTLIAPNNTTFFATHNPASFAAREIGGMMTLVLQVLGYETRAGRRGEPSSFAAIRSSNSGSRQVMAADIQRDLGNL